ncbi:MAG: D-alanine--D-alanine ligase [Thiobacillaceae bacterium]
MKRFGKVGVLLGGTSAEREISLMSGNAVLHALLGVGIDAHGFDTGGHSLHDLEKQDFDRVFIALHGRHGEDGSIQGALELMGIPYTGSGVLASSIGMDKWRTKLLWQAVGIPVARHVLLDENSDFERIAADLGLPLFVKPSHEGSSIGISKVKRVEELPAAYTAAAKYDQVVLAECFIDGMEVQFPVLGEQVLPSIRIESATEFYDYQAKYFRDDTRYVCPGLAAEAEVQLRPLVQRAFDVLGCKGWARLDLMLDQSGKPYFLEVNTVPGMTSHSLVPMAARAAGISFENLCVRILEQTL